ncbi:ABC transporter ATP-binding protein [Fervidibacillus halotolerans]|uniref:ABC transporter ATP-binding protein n=1 Tax=Fervidibacillus halotolerans TaxID=2980027 RepID=A0A9E8RZY2_9BACI|nr:ABC transporter ATP-binding protein [Fervidibacillus halotolerans]WAA13634.1 ABC transporter ATP-binding protein [Fervidibacillus halotolerans]
MIEVRQLTRKFGNLTALNAVSFNVERGTVFGFVGQNGAGKTTTFNILATLLPPTSGDAFINGYSVVHQPKEVRKQIGYMPDFFGVYDHLKVEEYLDFFGSCFGILPNERKKLIPQLLELVNLTDKKNTYVDLLSRGMKQRLCLARALVHDPEVLILDEPASGLDPKARSEVKDIIRELKLMGKTILISSHILPELAEMSDEIGIIEKGKLVMKGSVSEIRKQLSGEKVIEVKMNGQLEEAIRFFEDDPFVTSVVKNEGNKQFIFTYKGTDEQQIQLLRSAVLKGLPITSFYERERNLERVFIDIMKEVEKDEAIQ